ncbi:unnamed protein product [Orchesella dallaii]|uniref:Uncharacterized protein n=1 Tax=Orchesella dallaii TaxID=48710 RepID=A0ABP1RIL7_9HEXA
MQIRSSIFVAALAIIVPSFVDGARQIKFTNKCDKSIWISPLSHPFGLQLTPDTKKLENGKDFSYQIPDEGWTGKFWPRIGCDEKGDNCQVGSSVPFCSLKKCDPSADTKVLFHFPQINNGKEVIYYLNLMEGYTISAEVVPSRTSATCNKTRCAVSLDSCPKAEGTLGDLRVTKNGSAVMCLAPILKWSHPLPFGFGRNAEEGDGKWYSCLPQVVSPEECRNNIGAKTEYVKQVHRDCPTGFAYSHDDEGQFHNCSNDVNFEVNFCI